MYSRRRATKMLLTDADPTAKATAKARNRGFSVIAESRTPPNIVTIANRFVSTNVTFLSGGCFCFKSFEGGDLASCCTLLSHR